jgi:antitoxin ParD1/3/4
MITLTISLPETLKSLVDEQVEARGFGTSSDYVRALICQDLDRQHLRDQLLQGSQSAPSAKADASYFQGLRARVRRPLAP